MRIFGNWYSDEEVAILVFLCIALLAVVIWLLSFLASKAGMIAEDKGYDGALWKSICFWVGLFFVWLLPIPYILVAAMPDLTLRKDNTIKGKNGEGKGNSHNKGNASKESDVSSFLPEL